MKPRKRTLIALGTIVVLAAFGGIALASDDDLAENPAEGSGVAITGSAVATASKAALGDDDFYVVGDERETETDENDEDEAEVREALANGDDDAEDADEVQDGEGPDVAISGDSLAQASAKALEVVEQELGQSGTVSATEVGDEESYYEVEVTLDDGSQVDVQLDENFNFVGFD